MDLEETTLELYAAHFWSDAGVDGWHVGFGRWERMPNRDTVCIVRRLQQLETRYRWQWKIQRWTGSVYELVGEGIADFPRQAMRAADAAYDALRGEE